MPYLLLRETVIIAGNLSRKVKELQGVEGERNKLQTSLQSLEREADKLHRRLSASPRVSSNCYTHETLF